MSHWTDEEVEALQNLYHTARRSEIESELDRSWPAIRRKASRIGVSRHDQISLIRSVRNSPPTPCFDDEEFNNYIVGFVDGEGTFVAPDVDGRDQTRFRFAIELSDKDSEVLEEIKEYFGVGNMSYLDKRRDHWDDHTTYYVQDYGSLISVIIPFFDEYGPRAPQKKIQYKWWRKKIMEYTDFEIERFK